MILLMGKSSFSNDVERITFPTTAAKVHNAMLQLPGEEREREWIRARLETLSAQENIQLTAAALREPPQNTVDAVNQLDSLFLYWVRENAGSYQVKFQKPRMH